MITVKKNIPINIFDILNVFTLTFHVDKWSNSRPNKTKLDIVKKIKIFLTS